MAGLVPAIPIYSHSVACSIGMRGSSPRMTAEKIHGSMKLGSGDEVGRKPVADDVGGHLDGAVFRIAPRALAGETLLRAWNVLVNMDKGRVVEHHLAGPKLNQLIARADDLDLPGRPVVGSI